MLYGGISMSGERDLFLFLFFPLPHLPFNLHSDSREFSNISVQESLSCILHNSTQKDSGLPPYHEHDVLLMPTNILEIPTLLV